MSNEGAIVKARKLRIHVEQFVSAMTRANPQQFRVVKNRLPEDARIDRDEMGRPRVEYESPGRLVVWIASSVFRDDDPDDLPIPVLKTIFD
jgi:hypothetical protein